MAVIRAFRRGRKRGSSKRITGTTQNSVSKNKKKLNTKDGNKEETNRTITKQKAKQSELRG